MRIYCLAASSTTQVCLSLSLFADSPPVSSRLIPQQIVLSSLSTARAALKRAIARFVDYLGSAISLSLSSLSFFFFLSCPFSSNSLPFLQYTTDEIVGANVKVCSSSLLHAYKHTHKRSHSLTHCGTPQDHCPSTRPRPTRRFDCCTRSTATRQLSVSQSRFLFTSNAFRWSSVPCVCRSHRGGDSRALVLYCFHSRPHRGGKDLATQSAAFGYV